MCDSSLSNCEWRENIYSKNIQIAAHERIFLPLTKATVICCVGSYLRPSGHRKLWKEHYSNKFQVLKCPLLHPQRVPLHYWLNIVRLHFSGNYFFHRFCCSWRAVHFPWTQLCAMPLTCPWTSWSGRPLLPATAPAWATCLILTAAALTAPMTALDPHVSPKQTSSVQSTLRAPTARLICPGAAWWMPVPQP